MTPRLSEDVEAVMIVSILLVTLFSYWMASREGTPDEVGRADAIPSIAHPAPRVARSRVCTHWERGYEALVAVSGDGLWYGHLERSN